jgi:site-specific DNA recombinase
MEGQFVDILKTLQPVPALKSTIAMMFRQAWDMRLSQAKSNMDHIKNNLKNIDKQIEQFLERIVDATHPSVIQAYETKIARLEENKLVEAEKLKNQGKPKHTFEHFFEHALYFLSNPWKIWDSGDLHLRKTVLRLAFKERLHYKRNEGFLNTKKSLPFKVIESISTPENQMVLPR